MKCKHCGGSNTGISAYCWRCGKAICRQPKLSALLRTVQHGTVYRIWRAAEQGRTLCGKNRMVLFLDMLYCGVKYGAGATDYLLFDFYDLSAEERETYLTRIRSAAFVRKVNPRRLAYIFDDKNEFARHFNTMMGRETLNLLSADRTTFHHFMQGKTTVIAKPADGIGGHGIEKLQTKDFVNEDALYQYVIKAENTFGILEEALQQHPALAAIYPTAINTVRLATYVRERQPVVLYAAFRAGQGGSICDNTDSGGLSCRVDLKTGQLSSGGKDRLMRVHTVHPDTGVAFRGYQLPMWEDVLELVQKAAMVVPEFTYVGWDVCITPDGPVLVEGNDYPGYDLPQIADSEDTHPRYGLMKVFHEKGIEI